MKNMNRYRNKKYLDLFQRKGLVIDNNLIVKIKIFKNNEILFQGLYKDMPEEYLDKEYFSCVWESNSNVLQFNLKEDEYVSKL